MEARPAYFMPNDKQFADYPQEEESPTTPTSSVFPFPSANVMIPTATEQTAAFAFMNNYSQIYSSLNFSLAPPHNTGAQFGQNGIGNNGKNNEEEEESKFAESALGEQFLQNAGINMLRSQQNEPAADGIFQQVEQQNHEQQSGNNSLQSPINDDDDDDENDDDGSMDEAEEAEEANGAAVFKLGQKSLMNAMLLPNERTERGGGANDPELHASSVDQLLFHHQNGQIIGSNSSGGKHPNHQHQPSPQHQQQQQSIHQQPISVIIPPPHTSASIKQMDSDCCWGVDPIGQQQRGQQRHGPNNGDIPSSVLIRDDFIFSHSSHCASPPSTTLAGNEFLYDAPSTMTSSILEDSFLSSSGLQPNHGHSFLDVPCSSSNDESLHSTSFLDLHHPPPHHQHHRRHQHHDDGSVGISPCSSSTQISSGDSPDGSLFTTLQSHHHHPMFAPQFMAQPFITAPQISDGTGSFRPLVIGTQQQPASFRAIHPPQNGQKRGRKRAGQQEEITNHKEHFNDGEEEEEEDVKPILRVSPQQRVGEEVPSDQLETADIGLHFDGHFDEDMDDGDFGLSPPPPPLTPPSKTRSKMHDLALKSRLITSQNVRGQGLIQLSSEEKKTLIQEGFPVPTKLPLMREEEEALKIVRRKIKNKLSAQESRRKRKEYMDMLEKRIHVYFSDNTALRQKVRQLEATNRYLMGQLKHKQNANVNGYEGVEEQRGH